MLDDPRCRVDTLISSQVQDTLTDSVPIPPSTYRQRRSSRQMRSLQIVGRVHLIEARNRALKLDRALAFRIAPFAPISRANHGGYAMFVELIDECFEAPCLVPELRFQTRHAIDQNLRIMGCDRHV